jgi:PAS domain S-box-containing protein
MARTDKIFNRPAVEASELAENLIDTIREPLVALDKDLRVVKASRSFYDFFKVTPDETLGTLIYNLGNHQWDIPKLRELLETILPQKTTFENYEVEHEFSTIGKRFMLLNARKIQTAYGNEDIILLAIEDITERKGVEISLSESEKYYRMLFDSINDSVLVAQLKGGKFYKFINVNNVACKQYGYTHEEFLTLTADDINSESSKKSIQNRVQTLLNNNEAIFEAEHITKDGKTFPVEISSGTFQFGDITIIHSTIRNITERKAIEAGLEKKRNKQLETINAEKDKLFSIIAHDLKGPFQGFLGLTKTLAEQSISYSAEELKNVGQEMYITANRLFRLLRNLLEWAQMQKGSIAFEPKVISLQEMIAENVEIIKVKSMEKSIKVINSVTGKFQTFADKNMINSVLHNLLANAIKFTHRNGTVTIKANKTSEQMIEISVSDTGVGMHKSEVEKLFKLGERTRSEGTEGEESTGLGLLLCKEFVEKNGGKIWVESEEEKGSTFYFTLRSHE